MVGDILLYDEGAFGGAGSEPFAVAASATTIKAGEPVEKEIGNSTGNVVAPAATSFPVVGTDYFAGIAATTSTNTASAAGTVQVLKPVPGQTYLIAPKVAATWDTQAEYDALVGARVLIDLTTGSYTLLATDSANNGCVVEPLDIAKYPGKVRISFRSGANYFA